MNNQIMNNVKRDNCYLCVKDFWLVSVKTGENLWRLYREGSFYFSENDFNITDEFNNDENNVLSDFCVNEYFKKITYKPGVSPVKSKTGEWFAISGDKIIIYSILKNNGYMNSKQIAFKMNKKENSITHPLKWLENNNIITSRGDFYDKNTKRYKKTYSI